jgi:hypothetical protein
MLNIFKALYIDIHRKKMIEKLKPRFAFWYILANGDQNLISDYFNENYGIDNVEYFNKILKDVDLNDYIFILEKDFRKYTNTITVDSFILKKSDCMADYLFNK